MALPDTFTQHEVNNALGELKACLDDAKEVAIYDELEKYLPRFAYLLRNEKVLAHILNELPKAGIEHLVESLNTPPLIAYPLHLPPEPKARLSKQIAILVAIGEGDLNLWNFSEACFGRANKFWDEIFYPAMRDILRYATSAQKEFTERRKTKSPAARKSMSTPQNYALDLFISHSSRDEGLAKALIEFLRAALAIPHDRIRCTSVDGYKLSGGALTESALKREIQDAQCFIGLITPDSTRSQYVLFELGARWGAGLHLVPLVAGEMRKSDLRAPLATLNALSCADEEEMHQLVHDLASEFKKKVPLPTIYKKQLEALLDSQDSGFGFFK